MVKKLESIKAVYLLLVFFITTLISMFMFLHNALNKIDRMAQDHADTLQISLKSLIWNKEVPVVERESACDIYLSHGWNSYTKKECTVILNQEFKATD